MIRIPNTSNDLHLIIFPGSVAEKGLLIGYHSPEQGYARGNLPLPLRFLTDLLQLTFRCGQGPPLRPAISHACPLQSTSPNIIQSGFTCDASSSILLL
jgi:hypothetical protein